MIKNSSRYSFLLFLVLISLFSCNRRNDRLNHTTVSGVVFDQETHDSIAGATVYIIRADPTNPSLVTAVETLTSDSLGKFTVSFTGDPYYNYYAFAAYGNYLFYEFAIVNVGSNNTSLLKLYQPGYLALHIKNTSPFDTLDKITLYDSDYYDRDIEFNGNAVDTTIFITNYGNKLNQLYWRVTKNDSTISYNQSVNFISLDTIPVDLFY